MEFSARLLTCLGFALAAPCALFSAIIAGYDATENDRFANDPSFIAAAYDLSGVSHNNRWLTMISPNVLSPLRIFMILLLDESIIPDPFSGLRI